MKRFPHLPLAALALAITAAHPAKAQAASQPPAVCHQLMARTLDGIGINVASWIADSNRQHPTDADLDMIRDAGFRYVRLPFNPELLGYNDPDYNPDGPLPQQRRLDDAVQKLVSRGLYVLLDMHPGTPFRVKMETNPEQQDKFTRMWAWQARHLAGATGLTPYQIGFQLLNEPQYYGRVADWNLFQHRLWQAVREQAKGHLIAAAPAMGGKPAPFKLDSMTLLPDPLVVYAFPYYEPMIFSHQGNYNNRKTATGKYQSPFIRNLPYPAARVASEGYELMKGGNPDKARGEVEGYVQAGWNREKIRESLQPALDWARRNGNACLFVTEFGTGRSTVDPASRNRWLGDVASVMREHQIPAAVWDFSDQFGIVKLSGVAVQDTIDGSIMFADPKNPGARKWFPGVIEALGVRP